MNVQRHTSLLNRSIPVAIAERKLKSAELRDDSRSTLSDGSSDYTPLIRRPATASPSSSSSAAATKPAYVPYTYRSLPSTPTPIYYEVGSSKDDDVLLRHNQALQRQQQPFQRNGTRSSFSSVRSDSAVQRKAVSFGRAVQYDYTGGSKPMPQTLIRRPNVTSPNPEPNYSSNNSIYGVPSIIKSSSLARPIINSPPSRISRPNHNGMMENGFYSSSSSDYGYTSASLSPRTNQSGTMSEKLYVTKAEVHSKPNVWTPSPRPSKLSSDDEVFVKVHRAKILKWNGQYMYWSNSVVIYCQGNAIKKNTNRGLAYSENNSNSIYIEY